MTTYDQIYTQFIAINKTDPINIPTESEKLYDAIHSAIRHYNNRRRDNIELGDDEEKIDRELNDDELIILAHFLKLSFLENQLTYFTTLWQPFSRDIGLKNYQTQVKSLELLVNREENVIDKLINNTETDFM